MQAQTHRNDVLSSRCWEWRMPRGRSGFSSLAATPKCQKPTFPEKYTGGKTLGSHSYFKWCLPRSLRRQLPDRYFGNAFILKEILTTVGHCDILMPFLYFTPQSLPGSSDLSTSLSRRDTIWQRCKLQYLLVPFGFRDAAWIKKQTFIYLFIFDPFLNLYSTAGRCFLLFICGAQDVLGALFSPCLYMIQIF